MTLGQRLQSLRVGLGFSQEAIGARGFVSTPGWIKVENGQRQASEALIVAFLDWMVSDRWLPATKRPALIDELLTLKYLGSNQPFLRTLAITHAKSTPQGQQILEAFINARAGRRVVSRGRPRRKLPGGGKGGRS